MAEVVDELLVRLGLDSDKQSFQQAESQFASLRRGALSLAGTIGAGLGFQNLTIDAAKANDMLGLQAQQLDVSEKALDSFGFALERAGGKSEQAASLLGSANTALDQLQLGNIPGIDMAAQWGLNPDSLMESANAMQFMLRLAEQLEGMSTQQQRNVLDSFGLSGEGTFNLMTSGRNSIEDAMDQAQLLSPTLGDLVDNSRDFRESLSEMTRAVEGVTNVVSNELIKDLTQFSDFMTGFLTEHRESITETFKSGPFESTQNLITSQLPEWMRRFDWEPFGLDDAKDGIDYIKNIRIRQGQGQGETGTDSSLLDALMWQESRGRHLDESGGLLTNKESGARGAFQIMPATGRDPGYGIEPLRNDSPEEHERLAREYLAAMHDVFDDDTRKALAAYNAGPGRVDDAIDEYGANWLANMPQETQMYVPQVLERYSSQGGGATTNDNRQNVTIEINGATDPTSTANEVERILRRSADQAREDTSNGVY